MQTVVKERSITMHGVEVRAVLEGQMSQFWRVMKPQPLVEHDYLLGQDFWLRKTDVLMARADDFFAEYAQSLSPYGVGDHLWVKETMHEDSDGVWHYAADNEVVGCDRADETAMVVWAHHNERTYCPSNHMPRWASRLVLEVVSVRVERLRSVTEEDAMVAGYPGRSVTNGFAGALEWLRNQWDELNPKHPWSSDPWVFVIEFKRAMP